MADPSPFTMLCEGAQDAIDAFKALRIGMASEPLAIELIDALIGELEYALDAAGIQTQGPSA